jgi:8-amino-7-oxononanoate synthase
MTAWIEQALADLRERGLFRQLRRIDAVQGARVVIDGRELLNFSSNNYLGLAQHPQIIAAAQEALKKWGWGATASQLVSGFTSVHETLRRRLAGLEAAEDAVLFPTGYQANVGAITSLVGAGDVIIMDKLCHASMIDGARLSGAEMRIYPHKNLEKLARLLEKKTSGQTLVMTESIFSMDGDCAPLAEIAGLCEQAGAMLLVDEAHATGVLGSTGGGALELLGENEGGDGKGLKRKTTLIIGTLSKALGGIGGFAAGSENICDLLRNRARAAIYTTATPPVAAAAALAALDLLLSEPWRREKVLQNAADFRARLREEGIPVADNSSPIMPVIIGEAEQTRALSEKLFAAGILCPAIRPPTVAPGTSRLRFSFTADHSPEDVATAAGILLEQFSR